MATIVRPNSGFRNGCGGCSSEFRWQTLIQLTNVSKSFGDFTAIEGINLNVEQGEIVGFLGPNGAGKTTTMRVITGYFMPSAGNVVIGGLDMTRQAREARRLVGYLPEVVPLYGEMTTRAYLEYVGKLRGLDRKSARYRTADVLETCGLDEYADVLIYKLSKGYKQRVGLAQSIIHDPEVLILDEPTVGIDPIQVAETRSLIQNLGRKHTILLSSHILSEVSMLCERVAIINEGRIVGEDRIEKLSAILSEEKRLRLRIRGDHAAVTERLKSIEGVKGVTYEEPYHFVEFSASVDPRGKITEAIVQGGLQLLSMEDVDMSLEDIFLALTQKKRSPS